MRTVIRLILALILVCGYRPGLSQTLDEFIKQATIQHQAGKPDQAATLMEQALQRFPDNATVYAYLGLYRGIQAGTTQNYAEASELIQVAYQKLNRAVELEPNNPIARLNRGILSVNVPTFFGKLDEGIQDLETLLHIEQQSPGKLDPKMLLTTFQLLGQGYEKKGDWKQAISAWQQVIKLAPQSELAKTAADRLASLSTTPTPPTATTQPTGESNSLQQPANQTSGNPSLLVKSAAAMLEAGKLEQADRLLREAIRLDSTNVEAFKYLIRTTERMADQGYDDRIYHDTDFRTRLAFEVSHLAEKAVAIAPNDPELRLMRGEINVMMPFFVGKQDQGMEDLNWVIQSNAPNEMKAEARYWLGYGYQRKAITQWIKVVSDYKNSEASHLALASMRPSVQHLDAQKHPRPFVAIGFVLGFRDELAPQSAIWIEDKAGNFIKTIYVSGFSGHAKEKQANLTDWARVSKFRDCDAVTGASIDAGHYIYTWDLKDYQGQSVKAGEYVVKIEVAYWPSMQYQSSSAHIPIGARGAKVVIQEGDLVPYLSVEYFAR